MNDCIPRVFDVTQLVPVTTRVWAEDEAKAQLAALEIRVTAQAARGSDIVAISVGFPDSYSVKEVEQNAS